MAVRTQLYILTGFLGAGKTTLMRKLLEHLKGHKVGVIQNESGKVSIDGAIVRQDDVQMIEINNGSIFCACHKNGFVSTLATMAQREFEYLLVESTGIGDPSNVEWIISKAREASGDRFDFRGVLCLVDAANFVWQLSLYEEACRQIKHCHLAVITKSDLVSPAVLKEAEAAIRGINPSCPVRRSVNGDLAPDFLEEDLLQYRYAEAEESLNNRDSRPKTIFVNVKEPVDKQEFSAFLKAIGPEVLRVKGFADVKGLGMQQVDVVGKVTAMRPTQLREQAQLVFISGKGPTVIRDVAGAWKAHVSTAMEIKN